MRCLGGSEGGGELDRDGLRAPGARALRRASLDGRSGDHHGYLAGGCEIVGGGGGTRLVLAQPARKIHHSFHESGRCSLQARTQASRAISPLTSRVCGRDAVCEESVLTEAAFEGEWNDTHAGPVLPEAALQKVLPRRPHLSQHGHRSKKKRKQAGLEGPSKRVALAAGKGRVFGRPGLGR